MARYQILFRCVGEAVAAHGMKCLLGVVPFGEKLYEIAKDAHERYKQKCALEEGLRQVEAAAQAAFGEIKDEARRTFAEVRASAGGETAVLLADARAERAFVGYLEQVPSCIRTTFRRPADPTGRSVPRNFSVKKAEDFLRLLPARPPRFQVGERIVDQWVLSELLGVGGFGEVWKAEHARGNGQGPVALKFCLDAESTRYLKHEARLMDRVRAETRGPGVVELKGAYLDHDPPCLAFEYVNGGDVCGLMHDWLRLPLEKRVPLAAQVVLKLARIAGPLHRLDPPIVHRDLKPANVLVVRKDGGKFDVKIADFGIGGVAAKKSLAEATRGVSRGDLLTQTLRGSHTPLYASPEQTRGCEPDPRDDVHALGVIWFQLLTCDLQRGVGADFDDDLRELGVPEATAAAIKRCVASKQERRYKDAQELADHMATLGQESHSTAEAVPAPAQAFTDLAPQTQRGGRQETQRPERSRRGKKKGLPLGLMLGVAAGVLLLAAALTALVTLRTKYGDVVIELSDPTAKVEVKVDGDKVQLTGLERPLQLAAGPHGLTVSGADFETVTQSFTVKKGEKQVVKVTLRPKAVVAAVTKPTGGSATKPRVSVQPVESGFVSLFDGKTLEGWSEVGDAGGWSVSDGDLVADGSAGRGWLATRREYSDFLLRLEFSVGKGGNSGVGFRSESGEGNFAEIAILDETDPKHAMSGRNKMTGALHNLVMVENAVGVVPTPYYRMEIELRGRKLKVRVDDTVTVDTDLDRHVAEAKRQGGAAGVWRSAGPIGLQKWTGEVRFRNIRIKEMSGAVSNVPADASTYQGQAYKVFTEHLSWKNAKKKCEEMGGRLAVIKNAKQNEFVTDLVKVVGLEEAWLGGTDEAQEGKWVWVDGSALTYTKWFPNQPNNKNNEEHYLLLWAKREGQWADQPNVSTQHRPGYVCQWDAAR